MIGDWPAFAVALAAAGVILGVLALTNTTRTDDHATRIAELERRAGITTRPPARLFRRNTARTGNQDDVPDGAAKPQAQSQERPAPAKRPQVPPGHTEAHTAPDPTPPTQDIRAQAPPTQAIPGAETPAQRRARQDEADLNAWREEQARRAARRQQEDNR